MSAVSECYQAQRLQQEDEDLLQLMWADFSSEKNRHRHFYIKELAKTLDGRLVIPMRWICEPTADGHDETFWAEVIEVQTDENTGQLRLSELRSRICARDLRANFLELQDEGCTYEFTGELSRNHERFHNHSQSSNPL